MIKIANPSSVPPGGGFHVEHPSTKQSFKHQNITVLYRDYRKYCADNGLPVLAPTEIEQLICQQHPDWCVDSATRMPPIAVQVKNLVKEVAGWVIAGMPITIQEMATKRLTICNSCEFWNNSWCEKCGCSLPVKIHLETSHCPISKW